MIPYTDKRSYSASRAGVAVWPDGTNVATMPPLTINRHNLFRLCELCSICNGSRPKVFVDLFMLLETSEYAFSVPYIPYEALMVTEYYVSVYQLIVCLIPTFRGRQLNTDGLGLALAHDQGCPRCHLSPQTHSGSPLSILPLRDSIYHLFRPTDMIKQTSVT